ncbi:hypothetical protein GQ44DRAFT_763624 [Phaeosphaeriaceae sp. PMI808]|nr:hypothetical protein GQ44DRAFT_763624 [Phaeosphaeriaceae sp. PMI808]
MPMVYWVSTESPATIMSICLPLMLKIVRRFYAGFLSPLTSKVSSMVNSKSTGLSTMKSRSGVSNSGFKRSGANSDVDLQVVSNGSNDNVWGTDHRVTSTKK